MIFGLSRDGRLHIFFDEPFASQQGNGVRWMWRTFGPGLLRDGKIYIAINPSDNHERTVQKYYPESEPGEVPGAQTGQGRAGMERLF